MSHLFLPKQRNAHQVAVAFSEILSRFGYDMLELPIVENADLFLTRAGDQIIQNLLTFEFEGRLVALRPEFTTSAANHYLQHGGSEPVVRWQFRGPIFANSDVSSAPIQRLGVGAELIGLPGTVAEAEIISMAAKGLADVGVNDVVIILGHVGLLRKLLSHFGLDYRIEYFLLNHLAALSDPKLGTDFILCEFDRLTTGRTIDADHFTDTLDESNNRQILDNTSQSLFKSDSQLGERTREDIARRLYRKQQWKQNREQVVSAINLLEQWNRINHDVDVGFSKIEEVISSNNMEEELLLDEWKRLISLIQAYNIDSSEIIIRPNLTRNWNYYTGVVFELQTSSGIHLGGGGRYDDLIQLIGNRIRVPAVGFAYYVDALLDTPTALRNVETKTRSILAFDAETAQSSIRWAELLRSHGLSVSLMPLEIATSQKTVALNTLIVSDDTRIEFDDKNFAFSDISDLIEALSYEYYD